MGKVYISIMFQTWSSYDIVVICIVPQGSWQKYGNQLGCVTETVVCQLLQGVQAVAAPLLWRYQPMEAWKKWRDVLMKSKSLVFIPKKKIIKRYKNRKKNSKFKCTNKTFGYVNNLTQNSSKQLLRLTLRAPYKTERNS